MDIGLIGIDEEIAELSERELFTKTCQQFRADLPFPSVLLTTCQRTELYFASEDVPQALSLLSKHLKNLRMPIYAKVGKACFAHLASVTAGLRSALVGESDIQRQVKLAYSAAASQGQLTSALHFLFQKSLKVGKAVRSTFTTSAHTHSLEKVVYEKALEHMDSLYRAPLLFIGNSVTNRKIINFFQNRGAENITLCTRTVGVASGFCQSHRLNLMRWGQLSSAHHFEGVIVATHAHKPLLDQSHFPKGCCTQFLCDLSVPRCVTAKQAYDMDQITACLRQKEREGPKKFQGAQEFINEAVEKQIGIYNSKKKRVVVCA